jgi:2-keto-3-deoxy-L-rhamnonate aldolase RhmA
MKALYGSKSLLSLVCMALFPIWYVVRRLFSEGLRSVQKGSAVFLGTMTKNRVKELLGKGETVVGTWVTIGSPDVAELVAHMGVDWLVFDMEHAPLDIGTVQALMQATSGTEITPFVRVAWNDLVLIKRALDIGAQGLVIPWVNSEADAIKAVQAARYPPRGVRGAGPRRAAMYGLDRNYMAHADSDVMVIVQIETPEAVENVERILKVDGVDAFFIGPRDLSVSMGVKDRRNDPSFNLAVKKTMEVSEKLGVPAGIMCHSTEEIKSAVEKGFKFIAIGSDCDYLIWGANIALSASGRIRS